MSEEVEDEDPLEDARRSHRLFGVRRAGKRRERTIAFALHPLALPGGGVASCPDVYAQLFQVVLLAGEEKSFVDPPGQFPHDPPNFAFGDQPRELW